MRMNGEATSAEWRKWRLFLHTSVTPERTRATYTSHSLRSAGRRAIKRIAENADTATRCLDCGRRRRRCEAVPSLSPPRNAAASARCGCSHSTRARSAAGLEGRSRGDAEPRRRSTGNHGHAVSTEQRAVVSAGGCVPRSPWLAAGALCFSHTHALCSHDATLQPSRLLVTHCSCCARRRAVRRSGRSAARPRLRKRRPRGTGPTRTPTPARSWAAACSART